MIHNANDGRRGIVEECGVSGDGRYVGGRGRSGDLGVLPAAWSEDHDRGLDWCILRNTGQL